MKLVSVRKVINNMIIFELFQEKLTIIKECDTVIDSPTPAPNLSEQMLCVTRRKKTVKKLPKAPSSDSDSDNPWNDEIESDFQN